MYPFSAFVPANVPEPGTRAKQKKNGAQAVPKQRNILPAAAGRMFFQSIQIVEARPGRPLLFAAEGPRSPRSPEKDRAEAAISCRQGELQPSITA